MEMTLRRISAGEAEKGFRHVVSGFSGDRSGVDGECYLGREWQTLEQILLSQGPERISELPVTMGDLLGDDDLGTACFFLPPDEVSIAARFLSSVDLGRAVVDQADCVADTLSDGGSPDGHLEILGRYLHKIRDLYAAAERAGEGVAKLLEA